MSPSSKAKTEKQAGNSQQYNIYKEFKQKRHGIEKHFQKVMYSKTSYLTWKSTIFHSEIELAKIIPHRKLKKHQKDTLHFSNLMAKM